MELRPPALDDFGLPEAIRRYAADWTQTTGIPVDVYASGRTAERLPFAIETAVYRIVQEALTNILKHAQAAAVSIVLERSAPTCGVIVEDNGRGFDQQAVADRARRAGGWAWSGIRERAALAGGSVGDRDGSWHGHDPVCADPSRKGPKEGRMSKIRVMLVDDHAMLRGRTPDGGEQPARYGGRRPGGQRARGASSRRSLAGPTWC